MDARENVLVSNANHTPATPLDIRCSLLVIRLIRVLWSVDLDHQLGLHAGEVGDVGRYRVLTTEMRRQELTVPEMIPQDSLSLRRRATQGACAVACRPRHLPDRLARL